MSAAQRRLSAEITSLLDKTVMVTTTDGKSFSGSLVGINPDNMNLCLSEAKDEKGQKLHVVVLNGDTVARIFAIEKPFDLKALAERLEKVFPTMVRLYEANGFIVVMEKIKVTEKGVTEGTGPAAERVQKVYEQFSSEKKA
ncbi:MAG: Lsm family RNA-binding protein [Candidatus Bathyarchaeota archaeon]|nr:MAG: Lsm family RNA-binding protein [Candidatus Bathyarchaeota archaeon]